MGTRIPTGILLVAGVLLLLARPGEWLVAGIMITAAGVLRTWDLRRGRLSHAPWPLTIIALFMPPSAARSYLEEFAHTTGEVRGRERRRHVWNATAAGPRTLAAVWHDWLRAKLVRLTVRALSSRIHRAKSVIQDLTAEPRRYRAAIRRLRRYCRLILCATGSWRCHEYEGPARALLSSCKQMAENGGGAEAAARIRLEVEKLVRALASRRPDRA